MNKARVNKYERDWLMIDKEGFEKEKSRLLNNGLKTVKYLEDVFNTLIDYN